MSEGLSFFSNAALPPGWIEFGLKNLRRCRSVTFKPNEKSSETLELYSVPSHETGLPEIVKGADIGSNKQYVSPGDVLLSKINPRLNRAWIVGDFSEYEKIASTEWIVFSNSEYFDSKLLRYLLTDVRLRDYLAHNVSGVGGSLMRVKPTLLDTVSVGLPPLNEQHRIVAKIEELFSELDKGVESLKTAHEQLKVYRQAVLDSAASGRLLVSRRQKTKPFGDDESLPLEKVVDEIGQGWSPRCLNHPSSGKDIWGVIKTTAIQHLHFDESENKELPEHLEPRPHLSIKAGDILVTRAGPRKRVGVTCLVRSCRPLLMLCDKAYRLRSKPEKILPEYLEMLLNSPRILGEIEKLKTGISDSGVNLTQSRFLSLRIPLPSTADQTATLAELESILSNIENAEEQIEDALERGSSLRQSILKKAFSGQLVAQNANDEPASVLLERINVENEAKVKPKEHKSKKKDVA